MNCGTEVTEDCEMTTIPALPRFSRHLSVFVTSAEPVQTHVLLEGDLRTTLPKPHSNLTYNRK